MATAYDLSGTFALDEPKAREWIQSIIESDEGWDFTLSEEWRPIDHDFEVGLIVDSAIDHGIISKPVGTMLFFDYSDNMDGGSYSYLLDFGMDDLRLSEYVGDYYKIVSYGVTGVEAVLQILHEAVGYGNLMMQKVAAFVAANAKAQP